MPEINSINIGGVSYSLGGGGGNSQDIEDIKRLIYPSITTVCEEGEPITFTKGNRVITVTPTESGTYTQYIPELGTWTVEMESGGVEFSRDVEVENVGDGYSVVYPSITAEGEEGVPISFTKGELVIEKTPDESGVVIQYLPEVGFWTVETEIDGDEVSGLTIIDFDSKNTFTKGIGRKLIDNLSSVRSLLAATVIGDYSLWGGGSLPTNTSTTYSNIVETYNSSFVKGTISSLSQSRGRLSATSVGGYALFAGGYYYSSSSSYYSSVVDAYNTSLIKTNSVTNLYNSCSYIAATTFGNYALFAGGQSSGNSTYNGATQYVCVYSTSLVRTTLTNLTYLRYGATAISVGDYVLIAGGSGYDSDTNYDPRKKVESYNSNLVKGTTLTLDYGGLRIASTVLNNYAIIGSTGNLQKINSSLVVSSGPSIPSNISGSIAAANSINNEYALFIEGGKIYGDTNSENKILVCNSSFIKVSSKLSLLFENRNTFSSISFNDNILIGGGYKSSSSSMYSGYPQYTEILFKGYESEFNNYYFYQEEQISSSLGKLLIPKTKNASTTDDIYWSSSSGSSYVRNAVVRRGNIVDYGTCYFYIKKSLFNFSKYGDAETADNAKNYLTIMANAQSSGNGKHFYYTVGSGTSTHFSLVLYNVASPFRIYLQN